MINEHWRDIIIDSIITNYQVSDKGNIRNIKSGRLLKLVQGARGYMQVSIYVKGKMITSKVHRLVLEAFIPNPNNYPCINHKDEDKTNNCVDNLEWCNHSYNINYGTRNKRVADKLSYQRKGSNGTFYGRRHSDDTKELISSKLKGKEGSKSMLGKKHNDCTKAKMRSAWSIRKTKGWIPKSKEVILLNNYSTYASVKEASEINNCLNSKVSQVCNNKRNCTTNRETKEKLYFMFLDDFITICKANIKESN